MKEQKVLIAKEIQITPQPVVFMSSLTGIAVTALSVMATSLAVNAPEAATATETQTPQPVVFISQSRSFEVVTGEKLQQYETKLSESLGISRLRRQCGTITYDGPGLPGDCG